MHCLICGTYIFVPPKKFRGVECTPRTIAFKITLMLVGRGGGGGEHTCFSLC